MEYALGIDIVSYCNIVCILKSVFFQFENALVVHKLLGNWETREGSEFAVAWYLGLVVVIEVNTFIGVEESLVISI